LAIAWIASGEDVQVTSVIQLRRGKFFVALEQWPRAGIGMELELAGWTGLGTYDNRERALHGPGSLE
jgi:hypothetical protein